MKHLRRKPTPAPTEEAPSLFEVPADVVFVRPVIAKRASTDEQFAAFHEANPWVYDALVRLARDLVERGRSKIGMKMLFEVLRWQWLRRTVDPSGTPFKLNNNYTASYARLVMSREADLDGRFETREHH